MNKIYVCYFDYGDWDNCSHPVEFFFDEDKAIAWKNKNEGIYQMMELGQKYLPR